MLCGVFFPKSKLVAEYEGDTLILNFEEEVCPMCIMKHIKKGKLSISIDL